MDQQSRAVTRSTYVPANHSYPLAERKLAAQNYSEGAWDLEEAAEKIGCSKSAVKKWKGQYEKNENMYEHSHRPSYISPEHSKEVDEMVNTKSKSGILVSKRKFGTQMQIAANASSNDENKVLHKLSKRYIREYTQAHGISAAKAEVIDNAHLVALNDPRHAASHAAMMHYLHQSIPQGHYFNMDKTSFEMKKTEQETAPAMYTGHRPHTIKCDDPYPNGSRGNCSVHLFVVANDGGKVADLVYVVKDKCMQKDAIDVYEAPMLDGTMSVGASAYLMFVGESSPNKDEPLQWLFSNVVVPFINKMRDRNGKNCSTPASLSVDGDPRQLQVIASACIQAALLGANIIATKTPASCTPLFQPLDVGKLFLAAKTRFRKLMEEGYTPDNEQDKARLLEIFRSHRRKYPKELKKNQQASIAMGNYFSDVMKCLHTAAAALLDTMQSSVVKKSFESAGVSPYDPCIIRQKCQYHWSSEDKVRFVEAVPELSAIIARNFELKEKDFDDAHIPMNNDPKDEVAVHRRRSLVLHAPHVLTALRVQAQKRSKK